MSEKYKKAVGVIIACILTWFCIVVAVALIRTPVNITIRIDGATHHITNNEPHPITNARMRYNQTTFSDGYYLDIPIIHPGQTLQIDTTRFNTTDGKPLLMLFVTPMRYKLTGTMRSQPVISEGQMTY